MNKKKFIIGIFAILIVLTLTVFAQTINDLKVVSAPRDIVITKDTVTYKVDVQSFSSTPILSFTMRSDLSETINWESYLINSQIDQLVNPGEVISVSINIPNPTEFEDEDIFGISTYVSAVSYTGAHPPDLEVKEVTNLPPSDNHINYQLKVRNKGTVDVSKISVSHEVYRGNAAASTHFEKYDRQEWSGLIKPGEEEILSISIGGVQAGDYYIRTFIFTEGEQNANSLENEKDFTYTTIGSPIIKQGIDISVSGLQLLDVSNDITYKVNIKNFGDQLALKAKIKSILRTQTDKGIVEKKYEHTYGLGIASSNQIDLGMTLFEVPAGNHYLIVEVEAEGEKTDPETLKNNKAHTQVTVPELSDRGSYTVAVLLQSLRNFFKLNNNELKKSWDVYKNYIIKTGENTISKMIIKNYFDKGIFILKEPMKTELLVLAFHKAASSEVGNLVAQNSKEYRKLYGALTDEDRSRLRPLLPPGPGIPELISPGPSYPIGQPPREPVGFTRIAEQVKQAVENALGIETFTGITPQINKDLIMFGKRFKVVQVNPNDQTITLEVRNE